MAGFKIWRRFLNMPPARSRGRTYHGGARGLILLTGIHDLECWPMEMSQMMSSGMDENLVLGCLEVK